MAFHIMPSEKCYRPVECNSPELVQDKVTGVKRSYNSSPVRLLLIIAVSTFIFETLIMLILKSMPQTNPFVATLLDSSLLTFALFPVLYFFLFKPVIHYIRDLKRAEDKLICLNEELEERVVERTHALEEAHEELLRKEKLAAIGQLASGVGHELRNPLGVIGNAVYFLNMKLAPADEKIRKHMDIITMEVERADGIIGDLLDFSRSREPKYSPGDLNFAIRDTLGGLELGEKIAVRRSFDEGLPRFLFDHDQIHQVVVNLVTNAAQAMPCGGEIEISTRLIGGYVELSCRDSGPGIEGGKLEKIFEPLFTTRPTGTGLGLSIVKDIVSKHRGRISVNNEPDGGAVFTVSLPVNREGERDG